MKPRNLIALILITLLSVIMYWFEPKANACKADPCQPITQMLVTNQDTVPVTAWLTLGAADTATWIQNVQGLFGITDSGLVGSFILQPGDTLNYTAPSGKAIQGNFCFITQAYQCAFDSINTGSNIIEFCLNNSGTVNNAQETIEISCVPGVTYIGAVDFYGAGVWTANYTGYDTIIHIENSVFGRNTGLPGVYPVGCDNCTAQTANAPACTIGKGESPQKYAICNVQRNASQSGGQVVFSYMGPAYQILE